MCSPENYLVDRGGQKPVLNLRVPFTLSGADTSRIKTYNDGDSTPYINGRLHLRLPGLGEVGIYVLERFIWDRFTVTARWHEIAVTRTIAPTAKQGDVNG